MVILYSITSIHTKSWRTLSKRLALKTPEVEVTGFWFTQKKNTSSTRFFFESRTCPNISSGMSRQSLSPKRQTPNEMNLVKHAIVKTGEIHPFHGYSFEKQGFFELTVYPNQSGVCSLLKMGICCMKFTLQSLPTGFP